MSAESKYFDRKKYWLVKEGLSKTDAEFWKNQYLSEGYKVRVVKGTSFADKHKYSLYRRLGG